MLCGCRSGASGLRDRPPAELQVVHIVSERRLLAGFPLRRFEFATAKAELQPFMVAVVEGCPVRGSDALPTEGAPRPLWTTAKGRGLEMAANRIDPSLAVAAGDAVLIGGFVIPAAGAPAIEYMDVPPSRVQGCVIVAPDAGGLSIGCVMVPPGEYAGFIGGPVASPCSADGVRVWGVVVAAPSALKWFPATWIAVQRLH